MTATGTMMLLGNLFRRYVQRELCEQWMAAGYASGKPYIYCFYAFHVFCRHHCWVSFEGSAEIYNEMMRETHNNNYLNLGKYLQSHPMKMTGDYISIIVAFIVLLLWMLRKGNIKVMLNYIARVLPMHFGISKLRRN